MRTEIIDYLSGLDLGTYFLTTDVPWAESGTPLYLKNLKRIYVDSANFSVENFLQALDGFTLQNDVITVRVFFANDAKQIPANYDDVVTAMRSVRAITAPEGVKARGCVVSTEIINDVLVTELEYQFTKLLN